MAQRDLIFISYDHGNRKWLERLHIFLKPFVRKGQIQVWDDDYIQVGKRWERSIRDALAKTKVAVAMVTPEFIASDFIAEEELPALMAGAEAEELVIVGVPVSYADFALTGFTDRQWAWDLNHPIADLRGGNRNRALVTVVRAIVDAAEVDVDQELTKAPQPRAFGPEAGPAAVAPDAHETGHLHGVPSQRPNFVPRVEDRERVVAALLGGRMAVGVTGARRVGVHGQGGIGKSVLAIDVVNQEATRRAFPDGVYWLTIGQNPKLFDLQMQLAGWLGYGQVAVGSVTEGVELLTDALKDKRILLVLDDLWQAEHASALDALSPGCRLLVTTRDRGVCIDIGAQEERLDVLSDEAARLLLAQWVGLAVDELPDAADELLSETGNLPLAISLAGARISSGAVWDKMSSALRQGKLNYLDHPYGSVFASMQLSLDALAETDRARLLELAIFPASVHAPESVLRRLWVQTADLSQDASRDLLQRLDEKALLLYLADADGVPGVSFHDLQHDFLRLTVDDLPMKHAALITAYWPVGADLPSIPEDERYMWERMMHHLAEAGTTERLRTLLLSPAWLRAKLDATDIGALLEDFDHAPEREEVAFVRAVSESAHVVDDETPRLVQGALRLSAHIIANHPDQLSSQLVGRLDDFDASPIQSFLKQVRAFELGRWLCPIKASLTPPGGPLRRILEGHKRALTGVAVTPDGRRAVSASSDNTVKVWDLASGDVLHTLEGHTKPVNGVAVTPDGRRAVSASSDNTVKVWDLASGDVLHTLEGHTKPVNDVAVTPDGRRAVSGSDDDTLKVWDLASGDLAQTLEGHPGRVNGVAVTPDGRHAVSASWDRTLKVWDLASGDVVHTLEGHTDRVNSVAVTPDGRCAVSASSDSTLKVWDLANGDVVHTLERHTRVVYGVAVTPDGRHVVSTSDDNTLKVWDLKSGDVVHTLEGHTDCVNGVAVTPDGRRAVSASDDNTLKDWDLASGNFVHTLERHTDRVNCVAVAPDGRRAISASSDNTLRVWDLASGDVLHTLEGHTKPVNDVAVTPDGRRAVSASSDSTLKVWDLASGNIMHTLAGHRRAVYGVAVTPDGRRAVSASSDSTLKVWDLASGDVVHTLEGHTSAVKGVAVTPDGRRAVSASSDNTVKVWDLASGDVVHTLEGHTDWVNRVAVTPDGRRAVSASWDQTLKIWDLASGDVVHTLEGHTDCVNRVAVTVDGRRAVSASDDNSLKVWDLASGDVVHTLEGHTSAVKDVAVTPDGGRAVSASWDNSLTIWDLGSGDFEATFTADAPIDCCSVLEDGLTVVGADQLGRVHCLKLKNSG